MESYDECSSVYSDETIIWPPINFLCSLERLWGIPKEVVKVCKQIDSTVLFALLDDGTEIYDFQPKDENVPNLLRDGIQIYNSAPLTNNPLISAMGQPSSARMMSPMEPQTLTEMVSSMEPSTSNNEWSLNQYLESVLDFALETPLETPLEIPLEDAVPGVLHVVEQPPMSSRRQPSRRQPSRHCKRPFNYKYNF